MHKRIEGPVLYLDFDGVLHPDAAYWINGQIVLRCEGRSLFEWAPVLAECLEPYPEVQIVLSTSWVRVLSYNKARAWLPDSLAECVIGATWHSSMNRYWWDGLSRYQQIRLHCMRHGITRWIAIDDDLTGWPDDSREQLVATDSNLGIAAPDVRSLLLRKLEGLWK
ncbi:HAD domain-containing protein [Thiobacillus denitrificans]|uniref:Uncharacterized protein n=1 Tax=Thiobacillus denitrificans TaxID=36861 RepID=A0A125BCL5_THIDE|nr:HAD domain-containing protein [Thiobacillus denitrificans]KVW95884.1 hypothetical protein ABW22_09215 [Thiobacillus denitrificans]